MSQSIPTHSQGAFQKTKGGDVSYDKVEIPQLQDGDILIKVFAAPLNPSDIYLIKGMYPEPREFPGHSGIEGSGTVVKAQGESVQHLQGKQVAFSPKHNQPTGTYSDYAVSTLSKVFELPSGTDLFQGACTYINPFTVVYMYQAIKALGIKTVVHDVGASSLGKQMQKYFTQKGVQVINIVRRKEQVQDLEKDGVKYVLNSSDSQFWEQFKKLTTELDARAAFDAIGGEFATNLIKNMPDHSHIYQYGILSGQMEVSYNAAELLFQDKHVHSFWLVTQQQTASKEENQHVIDECTKLVSNTLSTKICKKFHPQDINEALKYYENHASDGKILITHEVGALI